MNANTSFSPRRTPRSMLHLRRAAEAAGYAVAGSPEEAPARVGYPAPTMALMGVFLCLIVAVLAIY
jgi:hypothetical protein